MNEQIHNELLSISQLVADIPRVPTYRVPEGYFDELPTTMAAIVGPEEAPLWEKGPSMPQQVPAGYFEQLPPTLLARVKQEEQQPGKVVQLFPKRLRWLAAACIVAVMGIAVWRFIGNEEITGAAPAVAFSQVSDEELSKYAEALTPTDPTTKDAEPTGISDQDIQAMLTDYSTEELEKYVKEQYLKEGSLH